MGRHYNHPGVIRKPLSILMNCVEGALARWIFSRLPMDRDGLNDENGAPDGGVAERLIAPVLKTGDVERRP